jgi:hypothetical protein
MSCTSTTFIASIISVSLFAGACSKKKDQGTATPSPATPSVGAPAPAPAPASRHVGAYSAGELWKAAEGASRLDDIYRAELEVKGTATKVDDDPTGEYRVSLDAGDGNTVIVTYQDFGAAARAAKLAAGQALDVKGCALTTPEGHTLILRGCKP